MEDEGLDQAGLVTRACLDSTDLGAFLSGPPIVGLL